MSPLAILLLLLGFSVLSVILFRRLNLPPVLGYLLVGAVIGPHAYNFLGASLDEVTHPAEYGVVFLMFSIGLEFSLPKLHAMRRIVFGLGLLQVIITLAGFAVMSLLLGLSWQASVALGGALSMSSTAVLAKLLADRMETDQPHGREVFGVLLFQDLAVVPLLILIPAFSKTPKEMAVLLGIALLKTIIVLVVVLFAGQHIMRRWFYIVAKSRSSELFILNVLLVTLGLSWITQLSGLSMALGAFLAGMLISETEYRHQVEEDIKPFRDVLMGLFFITIGMLLDVSLIIQNAPLVLLILIFLLLFKLAVVCALSRFFGSNAATAWRSGLWLCAGGEFGFVLLSEIRRDHLMPSLVLQSVLAALVLSMLAAPFIVHYSNRIVMYWVKNEWMLRAMQVTQTVSKSIELEKHAIICGFGRTGQYLARFLGHDNLPWLALDLDPDRVKEASHAGENVSYGNAAKKEVLVAAGISRASVLVISFLDPKAISQIMHLAHKLAPNLPIIVRAQEEHELDELYRKGAAEAVPEVPEVAMLLASHALLHMSVPVKRVLNRVRQVRKERYVTLRGVYEGEADIDHENDPRLHAVPMLESSFGIGKTLGELDLSAYQVEVSAIRRRGILAKEPDLETEILLGDILVLLGTPKELSLAEERLLRGVSLSS